MADGLRDEDHPPQVSEVADGVQGFVLLQAIGMHLRRSCDRHVTSCDGHVVPCDMDSHVTSCDGHVTPCNRHR